MEKPNHYYDEMHALARHGKTLKPLKKVFGNYILEDCLIHFPSERGTGKTFFMLEVCIAISNGQKSFCNEALELNGNTLYINLELGRDLMARRLDKLFEHMPFAKENEHQSFVFTSRKSFRDKKKDIVAKVTELKPVLVVLDNWKTAFQDIDSNRNQEATTVMIELLDLKDQYGFALVIVDHTKKGTKSMITDSDLQSGAGAKSDLADQDFFLRKSSLDQNFKLLRRIKSRICEEQRNPKLLLMNPNTLWFECIEEEVDELSHISPETVMSKDEKKEMAAQLHEEGKSLAQISMKLGIPKSTVGRWLK